MQSFSGRNWNKKMSTKLGTQPKPGKRFVATMVLTMLSLFASPALAFQLLDPPSQPVDAVRSLPVQALLATEWKRGPANSAKSKETFNSANARDEFTLVAYAVNRLHQNKTREAQTIAEELTTNFPTNLDGWMLKTWLNALVNKYDVSLINMRGFKTKIDAAKDLPSPIKISIYKRLGRLIGYMQGPVTNRVNKDNLSETTAIVTNGLTPDELKAFNEARKSVLKIHEELLKRQATKTQVELAKVKATNEQEKISLEKQNEVLERTESQLIPQREQVETTASNHVANLQQQFSSMNAELNAVSSDLQAAQLNLQFLYADLNSIRQQQQNGFYVSTAFIRNQIRNTEYNIVAMRNTGNQRSNQLNGIRFQISQTQNQARQRLQNLDRELKRLKGAQLRNFSKLTKIAGGPEIAGGKRNSMKDRAQALPTYDDLSMELYRQQMLGYLTIN